jgi:hypothetical protein
LLDAKSRGCVPGFFTAEKTRLKKTEKQGTEKQRTTGDRSEQQ